jgi:hypothetical protein
MQTEIDEILEKKEGLNESLKIKRASLKQLRRIK